MDKVVHVHQFHPMSEEDLFHALFDILNACEIAAVLHTDNVTNIPEKIKQRERNILSKRLNQAVQSAVALGLSGIPIELYDKFVMVAKSEPAHIFSDHVYDLNSPRLWEMLDQYQDNDPEINELYRKFYRIIRVALPDYILFRETGVAGLHIPGLT